jgi:hypothetical protein
MQKRYPLASKPVNLHYPSSGSTSRSTSPLKRSESPTKRTSVSSSPTKKHRVSVSPVKRQLQAATLSDESFIIYEDPVNSRSSLSATSLTNARNAGSNTGPHISIFQDAPPSTIFNDISRSNSSDKENSNSLVIEDKENPMTQVSVNNSSLSHTRAFEVRKPLSDLNINKFPAFITMEDKQRATDTKARIQTFRKPLQPVSISTPASTGTEIPLTVPWYTNAFNTLHDDTHEAHKRLRVLSYVTPPKKNRIKAYQFVGTMTQKSINGLLLQERSQDDSDIPSTGHKSPFCIHRDRKEAC